MRINYMKQIFVAFIWHQHQPYYKDVFTSHFIMPWTRLHGIKDYIGMANLLDEFPDVKATFNFTPVLLKQLEEYYNKSIYDKNFDIAKKKVSELSGEDKIYILDNFFFAHKFNMIKPFPRYWELFKKRCVGEKKGVEVVGKFTDSELLDLEVLFDLSWIHQTEIEKDTFLKNLKSKGRNFTEEEKNQLLEKELKILENIVPLHKTLHARHQIEIITSPFYHPILPLLCDFESAKPGLPDVKLPKEKISLKEDAEIHLKKAVEYFEEVFGFSTQGLWPSEGSVSEDIIPLLIDNNIKWTATDEAILSKSIDVPFRDNKGYIINQNKLYKPYRIDSDKGELAFVFRDRELSDAIGFDYHGMAPEDAAKDLIKRIKNRVDPGQPNQLVTILLDGENAWESYHENGIEFFRSLYTLLSEDESIKTTTVSEYLEKYPPVDKIGHLFPGSWVDANFRIWIGHEEDVRGWEYLIQTRKDLFNYLKENEGHVAPELKNRLLEELFVAEGSDWYWWFGDDHFSGMDDKYDHLFRQILKNIYQGMGKIPPDFLEIPIIKYEEKAFFSLPRAFLQVKIDGEISNYYEWFDSGYFSTKTEGGSMETQKTRIFDSLFFGFDESNFYLRLDFLKGYRFNKAKEKIIVHFYAPVREDLVFYFSGNKKTVELVKDGSRKETETGSFCYSHVFEMKISFSELGFQPKDLVLFSVYIEEDNNLIDKIPLTRSVFFEVPDELFEVINWRV